MTTTEATDLDALFAAWDRYDTDAPFVAEVAVVEAPVVIRCKGCDRPLTAASSRRIGRGRACQAKFVARVAAAAKVEQPARLAKAVELIEDGGLVRVGHLVLAMSSRGDQSYEVSTDGNGACTCLAAQHGRACYHVLAARLAA